MSLVGDVLRSIPGVKGVSRFATNALQNTSNKRAAKGKTGVLGFIVPPTVPVGNPASGITTNPETPWIPEPIKMNYNNQSFKKWGIAPGDGYAQSADAPINYANTGAGAAVENVAKKAVEFVKQPFIILGLVGLAIIGAVVYFVKGNKANKTSYRR